MKKLKLFIGLVLAVSLCSAHVKSENIITAEQILQDAISEVVYKKSVNREASIKMESFRDLQEVKSYLWLKRLFKCFIALANADMVLVYDKACEIVVRQAKCDCSNLPLDQSRKMESKGDRKIAEEILREHGLHGAKIIGIQGGHASAYGVLALSPLCEIPYCGNPHFYKMMLHHECEHIKHEDVILGSFCKFVIDFLSEKNSNFVQKNFNQYSRVISDDEIRDILEASTGCYLVFQDEIFNKIFKDRLGSTKIKTVGDALEFLQMLIIFACEERADILACSRNIEFFDICMEYFRHLIGINSRLLSIGQGDAICMGYGTLKNLFYVEHPSFSYRIKSLQEAKQEFLNFQNYLQGIPFQRYQGATRILAVRKALDKANSRLIQVGDHYEVIS